MNGRFPAEELGLADFRPCPFCAGTDTELHSAFGSQLSVVTYWCRRCHTVFEAFREERPDPGEPPPPADTAADTGKL